MPQDPRVRVFELHIGAYVVGVIAAAIVNMLTGPGTLWFIWVAIGWGIAVAGHGLAVLLETAHRRERIFVDPKARGFVVHLFVYAATCITLLAVNLIYTPQVWWWFWPVLGWGAGILAHGWCAFRKHRPLSPLGEAVARAREEQAREQAREKAKAAAAHAKTPAKKKRSASAKTKRSPTAKTKKTPARKRATTTRKAPPRKRPPRRR